MPKPRYEPYWVDGIKFLFKFDPTDPTLLHIYARHRKEPGDAIYVWFEADEQAWNGDHQRFEAEKDGIGLYWFWLEQDKVVMIISCFDLES